MTSGVDELGAGNRNVPDLPRLVFLDTNVVQNLDSFGDFIYENAAVTDVVDRLRDKGPRIREDVLALAELMDLGRRGGLPFVVSSRVIDELAATQDADKCRRLMFCGTEWAYYSSKLLEAIAEASDSSSSSGIVCFNPRQRHYMAELMPSLRDKGDRQLMIDALELGCEAFLTMDYKIWNARDTIRRFGIRVLRPVELMKDIRPLAGLLR